MLTAVNLMRIDPVYVYETSPEADDDVKFSGSLFLKQKPDGQFLEWQINENSVVTSVPRNNLKNHKHLVNFNLGDLKSVREASSELPSFTKLTFILNCGSTLPALHVPVMEWDSLLQQLSQHISLKRSPHDSFLHVVNPKKSLDDFNLFSPATDVEDLGKFFAGHFSKVTKYLHGFGKELSSSMEVLTATPTTSTASYNVAGDYKNAEVLTLNCGNGSEFEFIMPAISKGDLPARPQVTRGSPITACDWSAHMDAEGRVTNPRAVRQLIFRRGVHLSIRQEVWKFLLGYYPWDSTTKSRVEQRKVKIDDYFRMKLQWKSMDEGQVARFSAFRDRKSLVEKDVWRTDRNHTFFEGRNNPNMFILHDILLTHCMYHFDLGYVQGMSDLLAPILVIMEHEVDAFWSFAGLSTLLCHNFEQDQQSMKNQLSQLQFLIKYLDPAFSTYLECNNSLNMYFCFRWLLILFKREFSFPDAMRLWEVLWTGLPCQNFHLLVCLAILDSIKSTLIENDFGFPEILKFVNDLAGRIDVDEVLRVAEGMFLQLSTCTGLPPTIQRILGLNQPDADSLTSPFQPFNPFDLQVPLTDNNSDDSRSHSRTSHHSEKLPGASQASSHPPSKESPASNADATSDCSSIEVLGPFPGAVDPY